MEGIVQRMNMYELWQELGNIPVNDDGDIQESFQHFEKGTDREEIWHWFEETFDVSIHDLMYKKDYEVNKTGYN